MNRRVIPGAIAFALSMVGFTGHAASPVPAPTPGWVVAGGSTGTPVVPAADALAWRYIGDGGEATIDVWIASKPLTQEQRKTLKPARSGQPYEESAQPEAMGLAGLLVRFNDDGDGNGQMLDYCAPKDGGVSCSGGSGLGNVVVRQLDATHVVGEFYSRSADGKTMYVARFDAPLTNDADTPVPGDVQWSADGGEPGKVYLAHNEASAKGDVAVLKAQAMPGRVADFDRPGTVKMLQKMALKQPRVLAGHQRGDDARIYVQDTVMNGEFPPGVQSVSLRRVDGTWRIVQISM
ncbi:hypothetical protein [Tahibacter amnicola]|uniref:Uncharacterized protein n=1 Tax=Tahibacter amnicola TaxID=2976241 RepID=A0ABY6BRH2_9GAMM|nr:hypothetical protein [Tahibacter amnicola]UXI70362.1 hypothetical protein N4264_12230 [Tahibacter amnicola]